MKTDRILTAVILMVLFFVLASCTGKTGPAGPAAATPTPAITDYSIEINVICYSANTNDLITGTLSFTDSNGAHNSAFSDTNYYSVTAAGKTNDTISITVDMTAATSTGCTTYIDPMMGNQLGLYAYDPISGLDHTWQQLISDSTPARTKTVHVTLSKVLP